MGKGIEGRATSNGGLWEGTCGPLELKDRFGVQ